METGWTASAQGIFRYALDSIIIKNENKLKILDLLKSKETTIIDLAEKAKLSYTTVYEHIQDLKKRGYVSVHQEKKLAGKPVKVNLTELGKLIVSTKDLTEQARDEKIVKFFWDKSEPSIKTK